jgi:hypothetical protein
VVRVLWIGLLVALGSAVLVALSAAPTRAESGHEATAPLTHWSENELLSDPDAGFGPFQRHPLRGEPAGGTVTLTRSASGLSYVVDDPPLLPGHAYTVWWFIDDPDVEGNALLLAGPAEVLVHGGGGVADGNGDLPLRGMLPVGDYAGSETELEAIVPGSFTRPYQVVVMLFIKDHGPAADVEDLAASITRADAAECPCFDPLVARFEPPLRALPTSGSGGLDRGSGLGRPSTVGLGLGAAAIGLLAAMGVGLSARASRTGKPGS